MGVFTSKWVLTANTVLLKIYKKFSVTRIAKFTHEQIFFFIFVPCAEKKTTVDAQLTDHTWQFC